MVIKDLKEVVFGVYYIFIVVFVFVYISYFDVINFYMGKNIVIVGFLGQVGFEFECVDLFGDKVKYCIIVMFEFFFWVCRFIEFGKNVEILGIKDIFGVLVLKGE